MCLDNQELWEDVARDLNRVVWGWAAYFFYGSVAKARANPVQKSCYPIEQTIRVHKDVPLVWMYIPYRLLGGSLPHHGCVYIARLHLDTGFAQ